MFSEAVNPVALGKTRAKQYSLLKTSPEDCQLGDKVLSVQIHGDASFTGQGVVMESLSLSKSPRNASFLSGTKQTQVICLISQAGALSIWSSSMF